MAQLGLFIRYQCELCSCAPLYSYNCGGHGPSQGPAKLHSQQGGQCAQWQRGQRGAPRRVRGEGAACASPCHHTPLRSHALQGAWQRGHLCNSYGQHAQLGSLQQHQSSARSGGGGGGGGGGRGRKSAATVAKEKASPAAFLARKYGQESKLAQEAASSNQQCRRQRRCRRSRGGVPRREDQGGARCCEGWEGAVQLDE